MSEGVLEFKKVSKSFGKNRVLDSIDLSIPREKITGIIGASGEGKSTILKMIVSFYKPNSGKIYYNEREVLQNQREIKKKFGFSIEEGSFYEDLTVKENLLHFGKLYHVKRKPLKKRVEGMMHFVGLESASKILGKNLSLGMKKRLDLACSLMHKPSVLVLDEPTADLDPLLRKQLLHLIKKINKKGVTIIMTTQLMGEVEDICDNVAILYNEKIIDQGSVTSIKKKHSSKNLNDAFEKIFSSKGRKTYKESKKVKKKINLSKEKKKESDKNSIKKPKNPWDELEEKVEKDRKAGKFKDDL